MERGTGKVGGFWVKCKWLGARTEMYFSGRKKKDLSVDKHFPWLLKNDINVAGEDVAVVILAVKGLGGFQSTQYLPNITFTFTSIEKVKASASCLDIVLVQSSYK